MFRSGSSCSGSLSSGGDRSPGGYLRLDPNLPISSQFHDYFCNPLVTGVSFDSKFNSKNKGHKSGSRSSTGRGSSSSSRSRKQTPILISPGKKYTTSESLSEGESAISGFFDHSAGSTSAESVFRQQAECPGAGASSALSRSGGRAPKSGEPESSIRHRELHKTLEKNRRAHLRHCFEELRKELPKSEYSYKKSSHINIIHSAIRYINSLKKTEWENEHEIERLARSKIRNQNHLAQIRQEMGKRAVGAGSSSGVFKSGTAGGSASSSASSSKSSSPPATAPSAASPAESRLSPSTTYSFSWPRSKSVASGLE